VTGENFAQIDADVSIELWESDMSSKVVGIEDGVEIESDGSFEVEVRVPTETDGEYKVYAYVEADDDGGFGIDDDTSFRIGTMLVLLSEDSGVTGEKNHPNGKRILTRRRMERYLRRHYHIRGCRSRRRRYTKGRR
jgi:hypothetical protein